MMTQVPLQQEGERVRVLAVVVAYNSVDSLVRCLESLHAQTAPVDVLVVDNSQPRPLELDLAAHGFNRTRILWAEENLGPAGGFALGLAWFMESVKYSHAWVMDDDNYPEPDACEALLMRAGGLRPGSAIFPSVVDENTGELINYPSWCGVLIDRLAVRMAGLPMAELFWWAEDTEYLQHRMPRKGVIVARADDARVMDDRVRRVGGRSAWKYYYEVRNMIWFRIAEQRGSELYKLPRTVIGLLGSALTTDNRRQKSRMYLKGVVHGVMGRLGRQVIPPLFSESADEVNPDVQ